MRHCRQWRNGTPKGCTKKRGLEKFKVRLSVVLRTGKLTNQKNLLEYLRHTRPQKLQKFISRPMKRRFLTPFALLLIILFPRDTFQLSYQLPSDHARTRHYVYALTRNLQVVSCYIFQPLRFLKFPWPIQKHYPRTSELFGVGLFSYPNLSPQCLGNHGLTIKVQN